MTASAASKGALSSDRAVRGETLVRKLFALSGVVPLGIFLVLHLWTSAHALVSDASFTGAQRRASSIPGLLVLELCLVFAPLALHAAYGTWLTVTRHALTSPSVYPRGVGTMMRVTGIIALAYVAYHLFELRFATDARGMRTDEIYTVLSARLSSRTLSVPLRAMFYMLGVAAIAFHFAAGLWGHVVARGWARAPRARVSAAIGFGAIGAALFITAADVVTLFATGARLIGRDDVTPLVVDSFAAPSACPPASASAAAPSLSPPSP